MKHLISVFAFMACVNVFAQSGSNSTSTVSNLPDVGYPVTHVIGDHTPFIFYVQGAETKNWCLATPDGNDFKVVYGTLTPTAASVDSLIVKSSALRWGIDNFQNVYTADRAATPAGTMRSVTVRGTNNVTVTADAINPDNYDAATATNINDLYYTLFWLANEKNRTNIASPANLTVTKSALDLKPVYEHRDKGFYGAVEGSFAYSFGHGFHPDTKDHNCTFLELDAVGGWKFSERLGIGLGLGIRKYFLTQKMFAHSWGMPVYIDLRGNFMSYRIYKLVPFWIMDLGYTVPDGFMFRPQFGFKFGQPHQFTVSLGYVGQFMRKYNYIINGIGNETNVYDGFKRVLFSSISIKIGYEF
ncbi:MAG: hypothetical protein J1F20_05435 [Muribaculaceae bacterium]|nr:hypothetical protein [Muribaculaceae bacterium]